MDATAKPQGRRINWLNVLTVFSAAILIGAEVFGAAFAGGWAFANLLHLELGGYGVHALQGLFFVIGLVRDGALHPQRAARRAVHRELTERARALRAIWRFQKSS